MFFGKFMPVQGIPPYDIGNSTRKGILSVMSHIPNRCADKEYSNGNGGLMKILPLATKEYSNNEALFSDIVLFNRCSHNHIISHVGCMIYVYLLNGLLKGLSVDESYDAMLSQIGAEYKIPEYARLWNKSIMKEARENIASDGYVVSTLEATIWCLCNTTNYKNAVLTAVNLGEDTDTVAAVCGGLAGAVYCDIPKDWTKNIQKQLGYKSIKKVINKYINNKHFWRSHLSQSGLS